MDENSREGETSEDVENIQNATDFLRKESIQEIKQEAANCIPSFDASGPSTDMAPPKYEDQNVGQVGMKRTESQSETATTYQTHVRIAPEVEEHSRETSIGPPPSYSFVMKQKRKAPKPPTGDPVISDRPPPPSYGGVRGLYMTAEDEQLNRICTFPSFSEPIWRSHSQPALCPRCGILVLTTTHSHDSVATHVAALALCLFGCWPCCLIPYCMSVCKNTYHHCPICQAFLGAYSPW